MTAPFPRRGRSLPTNWRHLPTNPRKQREGKTNNSAHKNLIRYAGPQQMKTSSFLAKLHVKDRDRQMLASQDEDDLDPRRRRKSSSLIKNFCVLLSPRRLNGKK